jgi:hypothetical protein
MTLASIIEATIGTFSADFDLNIQPKHREIMKLLKLSLLTAAVAALVLGAGTKARALGQVSNVTDGTYTFTADGGEKADLNGSWVAFQGDVITNWELLDSFYTGPFLAESVGFFGFVGAGDLPPFNRTNSQVTYLATYPTFGGNGPDAFSFQIAGLVGNPAFSFSGQNNLYDDGTGTTISSLVDTRDPNGTWTWSPTSVPDASGTFGLFAGALLALGACKSFLRRRA